jgi:hypothetical protein
LLNYKLNHATNHIQQRWQQAKKMHKAIEDILPRNQTGAKKELEKLSSLIDFAVDFGTHLLKWQADKMQSGDQHLVPILFFRNILELADSISILIKNSSVDPAKSLIRSLLENSFGLEYLLEKDQKNRSLSFNIWRTHKELKFYNKLDKNTKVGKQFLGEIKKDLYVKEFESDDPRLELEKKNAKNFLKLPHYISIEKEYQRTNSIRKNPNWFTLFDGPKDIEQLAKRLNHHSLYEFFYRRLSDNVHATDLVKGKLILNKNGQTDIIQIRFPKDAQDITIQTLNILVITYKNFYEKELPDKKDEFYKWYLKFCPLFKELRENELFKTTL